MASRAKSLMGTPRSSLSRRSLTRSFAGSRIVKVPVTFLPCKTTYHINGNGSRPHLFGWSDDGDAHRKLKYAWIRKRFGRPAL